MFENLLAEIRKCTVCQEYLPLGANPVVSAHKKSKILIVGQAPGTKVHQSGIPWDDQSGKRLREWMGIDTDIFYNTEKIAIIPMGFCYPGRGKSGDLPPRKECAPLWHSQLLKLLPNLQLTLLIGQYAQKYYLKEKVSKKTLTETVKTFYEYLPSYIPLPHPSPRNNIWMRKNSWFEEDIVPVLQTKVKELIID
ncbi:uracil-DNA glycosylase family protein [Chondrinema litorale]|uniref:uracil-DNA glycosylase family protein n=1 Tax=Chondrinema litorale TaxID=2994555 RepID=UPI00254272A8|nr:uracil-DNA glycosylase family protein [Chondrinema litorale]UZR97026.1 uracil-DNA glycosylase family protein [Chondrinema litorale]